MKSTSGTKSGKDISFRMPAEWEPHEATWLAWPHYKSDWPGKFEPIPWVYAEIIRNLARHERVELIVNDVAAEKSARKVLGRANALSDNVCFHRWPTNRVWTRDSGCTFVRRGGDGRRAGPSTSQSCSRANDSAALKITRGEAADPRAVCWRFNAWAKYSNYQHDAEIGVLMAEAAEADALVAKHGKTRVVLEGGSIDVNGQGTLLTTEECLLSKVQQRNRGFGRQDYEKVFAEYLGIKNVIWLASGITGDDTHGHVDDITRFVAPDTVVTAVESDPDDPNYEPLRENIRRLREATDQDGKPLSIIELPMPSPVVFEGRRLPASYANFYIANELVLVPVFNDPNDRVALDILADLFPDRDVIGIYSGDLIWGFGAMHCMTQQQPAV
ncbi:MAG TPA: agmatine deiminase family protein [Terriglobales bacterium]|nr:agmatine deiminase family protein [Terriglobales bacterium]